ncbi:MAG: hypothetical protein KDI79_25070 [Anaerolineae bacterium]|nr:hypothetical protein [Anaerolineae bacterium]
MASKDFWLNYKDFLKQEFVRRRNFMNRKLFFAISCVLLVLLLGVAVATAHELAEEGTALQDGVTTKGGAISLASSVANKISYHGQLTDANGNPLNGTVNLIFQFWDDAAAGNQVGSDIVKNEVPVNDGLFTVELDVPENAFNGDARWLRVQVNGEWLTPRTELLAVPYALGLKPGAVMQGQDGQIILRMKESGGNDIFTVNEDGRVFIDSHSTLGRRDGSAIFVRRTNPNAGVGIWSQTQGNAQPLVVENTTGWGALITGFGNDGGSDAEFVVKNDGRVVIDSHTDGTSRDGAAVFVRRSNPGTGVGIWSQTQGNGEALVVENVTGSGALIKGFGNNGGQADFVVHNNGQVDASILRITGGSDLSEQFEIRGAEADPRPSPGMVVSIDPENPGELLVSAEAYDKKVAGIISGAGGINPGMLMGQADTAADGEFPVALTGRVYVQADASSGPIQPGDLLTTSDTPGHAMKVIDHEQAQGAILGKAMTALDEGQGLVLVLVSLQ